jgi:hypothetical protein
MVFHRSAAGRLALSREVERRLPSWQARNGGRKNGMGLSRLQPERQDRTTCSAYSVRPLPDARVSTPLFWDEVPECDPADFTMETVPRRFKKLGDPHAAMNDAAVHWRNFSSSQQKMRRRASRMRRGLHTIESWKGKRRASHRRVPGKSEFECLCSLLRIRRIRLRRWRDWHDGKRNTGVPQSFLLWTTCSWIPCVADRRRGHAFA